MTKCPKCQKELEDGFSFCPACGSAIAEATPGESMSGTELTGQPAAPESLAQPAKTTEAPVQPAVQPESPAEPDAEQVAEQLRLLAEKEAEKERKKAERLQRLAGKKVERQQRNAERKVLAAQRKEERALKLARQKQEKEQKPAASIALDATAGAAQKKPASFTIIWVLIILAIVVAMAAAGTGSYFLVKQFWAISPLVSSGLA